MLRFLVIWALLIGATTLESSGDALVRIGLFDRAGAARVAIMAGGAALLFGYGVLLNLTPLPFGRVVGLYIATLFLAWQVVGWFAFKSLPSLPVMIGGALIVTGGLIVSFWAAGEV